MIDMTAEMDKDEPDGIVRRLNAFGIALTIPQKDALTGLAFDEAMRLMQVAALHQLAECVGDVRSNTEEVDGNGREVVDNLDDINRTLAKVAEKVGDAVDRMP